MAFKCESCNKTFWREGPFKRHVETVHENIKPFRCVFCDKRFGEKQQLKRRTTTIHDNNMFKKWIKEKNQSFQM